jgi:isopentenyl phosphate kinase
MTNRETGLVLVKLGGSVITDKSIPFAARRDRIRRLAREISRSRKKTGVRLIVGHGGGSFPHTQAEEFQTHRGIIDAKSYRGIALVQDAAARLHRIVVQTLLEEGENAISIQPSAAAMSDNSRIIDWDLRPVEKILAHGLVPVVYGDVGMDVTQGCCILSTEEIFRYIATKLPVERIVIGSNVNGVYDKDPQLPDAKQIPVITLENFKEISSSLGGSPDMDVTGGMKTKVTTLLEIVGIKNNICCRITDITESNTLERALCGEEVSGTIIRAK